jgi:hypothetical protein
MNAAFFLLRQGGRRLSSERLARHQLAEERRRQNALKFSGEPITVSGRPGIRSSSAFSTMGSPKTSPYSAKVLTRTMQ